MVKIRRHALAITFLIGAVCHSFSVYAAEPGNKAPPPEAVVPEQEGFEWKVLKVWYDFSKSIEKTAEKTDLLLAGKKYTDKVNETSISLSQLVGLVEGGRERSSTDFGINLRLPNLEKRWQLRFTSYDEEEEARDLQQRRVRTRGRDRDYGAGLFFFRKLGNVKVTYQPRLALKDPLEVSHNLRFESVADQKPLRLAPSLRLFAEPEKGTGVFGAIEFIAELNKFTSFSVQNEAEYRERGNYFLSQHGVGIDYALTDDKGVGFATIVGLNNRPTYHLDILTLAPAYSHEIYLKRLKYSLTPYLAFAKGDNFKGKAGISLTVELVF